MKCLRCKMSPRYAAHSFDTAKKPAQSQKGGISASMRQSSSDPLRHTPVIMLFSALVKADRLAAQIGRKYAPFQEMIARTLKSQTGDVDLHSANTITGRYKTIDDLPGPSLATTVYWLFVKGYADKSHAMQVKHMSPFVSFFFLQNFNAFVLNQQVVFELITQFTPLFCNMFLMCSLFYCDMTFAHLFLLCLQFRQSWPMLSSPVNTVRKGISVILRMFI